jgi:hypothetical protein
MENSIINNTTVQNNITKLAAAAAGIMQNGWSIRSQLLANDAAYMRERNLGTEHIQAKRANAYGDKSRIQDVVVPIVMPQVESAVAYLSSVFLSGYPIFGVTAGTKDIDAANQMDTLVAEHSTRGGWVRELNLVIRDSLKHNIGLAEVSWDTKTTYAAETDNSFSLTQGKPKKVLWEGNVVKRLDPYNCFWDIRVSPAEVHSLGEFAGYHQRMGHVAFKQFIEDLGEKTNIAEALASKGKAAYYYEPLLNPDALVQTSYGNGVGNEFDWRNFLSDTTSASAASAQHSNSYEVTTLYARIIPAELGIRVPAPKTPQVWKFLIVNGSVVISAERQTNMHNFLPILICQPLEDGLKYQTKSFAQNVAPLQEVSSALLNSALHSQRRKVFDRLLYDPSRVRKEDINNSNPVARIPVRPTAYGKPLHEAVYPFPYNDSNSGMSLQEIQMIKGMADSMQGINQAQQGQFVKGNKTQHEYADVMSHSNSRLQTMALFLEAQFFTPMKEILKLNILQFAKDQEVFNRETNKVVKVDTTNLRTAALAFKVSDGFLPTDKLISAETFQTTLQMLMSSPEMQMQFDAVGFMVYYLKSQGAKDLDQFKFTPEQQQQRQQQMLMQQQAMNASKTAGQ